EPFTPPIPCATCKTFAFKGGDIDGGNSGKNTSDPGVDYNSGQIQASTGGIASSGFGETIRAAGNLSNQGDPANDIGTGWSDAAFPTINRSATVNAIIVTQSGNNQIYFM